MYRKLILVAATALMAFPASAATRNCTAAEKAQADQYLLTLQHDTAAQQQLLRRHAPYGVPAQLTATHGEQLMYQDGYLLNHDTDLKTSVWASYALTNGDIQGARNKDRVNCFRPDPRLSGAVPADYDEPIFDQGHIVPDADLKDDLIEQVNSYMMSNMSPQQCRFNRGIWLNLEYLTRSWAADHGSIWVTSGAIFDRDGQLGRDADAAAVRMVSRNGNQNVAVPTHYYRNILRKTDSGYASITFVLENTNANHGVQWAAVRPVAEAGIKSLHTIEQLAGVRLHPALPRGQIVETSDGTGWDMAASRSNMSYGCRS